jgi:hypothetical protein
MSSPHSSPGFGRLNVASDKPFNGVKVFSATMVAEREKLGERITEWLQSHPRIQPIDAFVTQSSDEAFHCLAITVFYWEDPGK